LHLEPPDSAFVRWFRASSPYIHAHRGRTFVVSFGGEALADPRFPDLIHDFALLDSLGVRLVLVHGIRPQIEERLALRGASSRYKDGLRITDATALQCVKEAAGLVRVEIEALLSMGLANSPMAGVRVRVASGNFVTARPIGIRDGVDFAHTGAVRRIDAEAIRVQLDQGNLVLLSPVGYSPTGEAFNLSAEEVATETAIALRADKLLLLLEGAGVNDARGQPVPQLTTTEAEELLSASGGLDDGLRRHLSAAVRACQNHVARAHLIDRSQDGALLQELFTRDGRGTLVSRAPFETLRPATLSDVGGILELIAPLEAGGVLTRRTRERLEMDIGDYAVLERDGMVVGCAALHDYADEHAGELACLAVHPGYRGAKRGERLLDYIEARARAAGCPRLFALTTQTEHWFREHGFVTAGPQDMPEARRALYDLARNSRVLVKTLKTI
jgi:amino-acid N-acetyltransferase